MPPSFRTPASASNALYVAERAAGMNSGDKLPASAVSTTAAMSTKAFSSATGSGASFGGQREAGPVHFTGPHGRIENTPHDVVHVIVGGDTGWMSDPNTAAQDPIFWLHHANIDRLWKQWLRKGAGRANPTGDSIWMTTTFSFFDEDGHEVKLTGKEVLDTASQLEYRYDDEPAAPLVAAATPAAAAPTAAQPESMTDAETTEKKIVPATDVELGNAPVHARLAPAGGPAAGGPNRLAKIAADLKAPEHIVLHLDDIQYDRSPGHFFEVYVNLPDDVTEPNFQSPHYADYIAERNIQCDQNGQNCIYSTLAGFQPVTFSNAQLYCVPQPNSRCTPSSAIGVPNEYNIWSFVGGENWCWCDFRDQMVNGGVLNAYAYPIDSTGTFKVEWESSQNT